LLREKNRDFYKIYQYLLAIIRCFSLMKNQAAKTRAIKVDVSFQS